MNARESSAPAARASGTVSGTAPRVLLILPCYNEGPVIGRLLEEIQGLHRGYDAIVIDDGSSDDTYEEARKHGACVRLPHNLGIGGAVQTGIKYAYSNGYD